MNTGLGMQLREQTRELHIAAERRPFMQALLRGRLARAQYCLLLRNLHPIYTVLESALQAHATHPMVAPVFDPALTRADALAHDLACLHGARWQADLPLVPAARHYCERLVELQHTQPPRLTAHAYVRYLGDLSGGQLLKRIVRDGLGLTACAGTDFYEFGDAQRAAMLAQAFRTGLQNIPADPAQAEAIVAEARHAYRLHLDLFDQLAAAAPA